MDSNTHVSLKMSGVWLATVYGAVSTWPLAQWVLLATLIYTIVQTAKVTRDWIVSRRDRAEAKAKELLADARTEAKVLLETARKAAE